MCRCATRRTSAIGRSERHKAVPYKRARFRHSCLGLQVGGQCPGTFLLSTGEVQVVVAVGAAVQLQALLEVGVTVRLHKQRFGADFRVLATILVPVDGHLVGEDARLKEGADVEADAVIEIRIPADRLFGQRLPAHVNVIRRLAVGDLDQLLPERSRRLQARRCARFPGVDHTYLGD